MNKLLTVALLVQGSTAFAPIGKPLTTVGQQRDGKWRRGILSKHCRTNCRNEFDRKIRSRWTGLCLQISFPF